MKYLIFIMVIVLAYNEVMSQSLSIDTLNTGPAYDSIMSPNDFTSYRFTNYNQMDVHQGSGMVAMVYQEVNGYGNPEVWCVIYDEDFAKVDTNFRVNYSQLDKAQHPTVVWNQNSNFAAGYSLAVAWSGTDNGSQEKIYVKKIEFQNASPDFSVVPLSSTELCVVDDSLGNTPISANQQYPIMTFDHNQNELFLSWRETGVIDGSNFCALGQRVDFFTMTKVDTNFVVNTTTTGYQFPTDADVNPVTGELIVTIQGQNYGGTNYDIAIEIFDRNSTLAWTHDTTIVVDTSTTYSYSHERGTLVPNFSSGEYIISWNAANLDGSGYGVYGRVFNSDHSSLKSQFRINMPTTHNQAPAIAAWDEETGQAVFFYYFYSSGQQTLKYQHFEPDFDTLGPEQKGLYDPNTSSEISMNRYGGSFSLGYDQARKKVHVFYPVYQSSSSVYSKAWYRQFTFTTPVNSIYAELKPRMDGGFHTTENSHLFFFYDEIYSDADTLNFRILDKNNSELTSLPVLTYEFGRNWYDLNLTGKLTSEEFYILEIRSNKGDLQVLKFIAD